MAKAGRGSEQVMIRLPDGMRDTLKEIAAANGRSMNAEIVERLGASLQWPWISISPELHDEAIDLPMGILSELEAKIKADIEFLVGEALYNHKLSQSNLVHQFESIVEYAPEEERPKLRQEIRDLLIRAGVSVEAAGMFAKDD
ncbi:Arc family DNA-binding protein [Rhizobium oryzihabitans]|uniref:Arc family DNA-binding protein n=1 Tax=Rhizobium oryzihabitans TaxID=2267833 RepID=A0A7L5BDV1_9HYPH|nr:Arc family DNA-binding protein [Rhizobium oryzihabitans]QIB37011.1 Arc family DNA-binding protein [Rhizobium oryzihabitans]